MHDFTTADIHRLNAAEGWLGLGDAKSATEELDAIDPQLKSHPAVLTIRHRIHTATRNWQLALDTATALTEMLPAELGPWIDRSYALHELKRTIEARANLLKVICRFPKSAIVHYNLACYECQLGNHQKAVFHLKQAFALPGGEELRASCGNDPDLAPIRDQLAQL